MIVSPTLPQLCHNFFFKRNYVLKVLPTHLFARCHKIFRFLFLKASLRPPKNFTISAKFEESLKHRFFGGLREAVKKKNGIFYDIVQKGGWVVVSKHNFF